MKENSNSKTQEPMDKCKQMMGGEGEKEMCPMATMCKGMMGKPGAGYLLMVPGAALILVGILILIKPKILFWLIAGTSILIGIIMLVFANFIRKTASE
ncbi:MAG: hypothetical protein KAJ34_06550 [Thermodesulfovibrionia bacterium]|nr:hypothetical protein [Thermodesulfovibrionia bacterium]